VEDEVKEYAEMKSELPGSFIEKRVSELHSDPMAELETLIGSSNSREPSRERGRGMQG
jgi:hypothetical protein